MRARQRCLKFRKVTITCAAFPDFIPTGALDLIVLSEIGYYFDRDRLSSIGNLLTKKLNEGASLIASHWLGSSPDQNSARGFRVGGAAPTSAPRSFVTQR